MAKDDPKTRPKPDSRSPFRRFEELARKIVNTPKDKTSAQKGDKRK